MAPRSPLIQYSSIGEVGEVSAYERESNLLDVSGIIASSTKELSHIAIVYTRYI
jgi:hypothetical protein